MMPAKVMQVDRFDNIDDAFKHMKSVVEMGGVIAEFCRIHPALPATVWVYRVTWSLK